MCCITDVSVVVVVVPTIGPVGPARICPLARRIRAASLPAQLACRLALRL